MHKPAVSSRTRRKARTLTDRPGGGARYGAAAILSSSGPGTNASKAAHVHRDRNPMTRSEFKDVASKVPAVTLGFWAIKILATTLGETGGDTVTMTMKWGYLVGSALFVGALVVLIAVQIMAKRFHPFLYWATIIASTTAGTTMADFADRSLGIGYAGGASLLLASVLTVLGLWYWSEKTVSVDTVTTPKVEVFYWIAITLSQTLGTALGDWMADNTGLGYLGGAAVFSIALLVVAAAYFRTKISRVTLFWAAFILTRPLGATVGDLLDKPHDHGGLALSRPIASLLIAALVITGILLLPQKPSVHPGASKPKA
jgi:uncharacterized membrane-anchored protein